MVDNNNVLIHSTDGGKMECRGIENNKAIYVCRSCGYRMFKDISSDDATNFLLAREDIMRRVEEGIINYQHATHSSWNTLKTDILELRRTFQVAREDIGLDIAILACLTHGFRYLDKETYRECKPIFKVAEKIYKQYLKDPAAMPTGMANTSPSDYERKRKMYMNCVLEFGGKSFFGLF